MDLQAELARCGCATRPARLCALIAEWMYRYLPGKSAEELLADAQAVVALWAAMRVVTGCPPLPLHAVVAAVRETEQLGTTLW